MGTIAVRADRSSRMGAFSWGFLFGILVAAAVVWGLLTAVQRNGINVRVDTAPIAAQVETQIRTAVKSELPGMLAQMRKDLPGQVAGEIGKSLAASSLDIGGYQIPVPSVIVQQVQTQAQRVLQAGLEVGVKDGDLEMMAQQLGDRAASLVNERLHAALAGQKIVTHPLPWLSIPVTIIPE